ncbi:MAG: DUF2892 domain-containing protein [Arcobacteraceae bacterium]
MNTFDKIRKICRPIRIVVGIILIALGFITSNAWFYLGVIPLIAGLTDFCPLCKFSKKCSV